MINDLGCICLEWDQSPYPYKGGRTGREYLSHLENIVKRLMEGWFLDGDEIYQVNNATPSCQNCTDRFNQNPDVFHHLQWPSKSPDTSVIENLLDELERHL
ncbi:hypothetical protein TNCV_2525521 [Trichonephila clavipes]|nr:hypothetical protein TNCV_530591 [Trichonephila clavipes]GFV27469.1 hypothetical protein TNCV_2525521 [Trichonephila clavipes]